MLLNFTIGFIADVDPEAGACRGAAHRGRQGAVEGRASLAHVPAIRRRCVARSRPDIQSRDSNNTTLHKVLANGAGQITLTGAISPSGLAMRPIRYALLDEVDRYPASAGTEGDPVSLAIQRTAEFAHNKKIVMASTPTIKGASRIELAWRESDQRRVHFVPCPRCGYFQVMVLFGDGTGPGVVWSEGKPEDAM